MRSFTHADALAEWIIDVLGPDIRAGLPLGIGKATHVVNALFARARADASLHLELLTALTLDRPTASSELGAKFLDPFVERHFAGHVELDYAKALRAGDLPANVHVAEFFFNIGKWLHNAQAQRDYVSVNYSAAARDVILARPINLLAQLLAVDESGPELRYSLSCNPDVTLDILPELESRRRAGAPFLFVGQVNRDLPFMPGSAEIGANRFDAILDDPSAEFPIFAIPRRPVSTADYVAGLHVASLVEDGGTLQIGIGSLGDAVAYALILRHRHNAMFRRLISQLTDEKRRTDIFSHGLYAASEMFVEGLLELYDAGILKRRSQSGHVLHSAFFVGSRSFYDRLKALPEARRADFDMTAVSFTNALYGDEERKRRDRRQARFINNVMMADLLGAAQSDTLGDGRVVSGVGGQHDFVEQAIALEDAHSILLLNAVRIVDGRPVSNIAWQLDRTTIPRHMRDVVVSEYGVAKLKGASDAQCIARMVAIADSRFQEKLLGQARQSGKTEDTQVQGGGRNRPDALEALLAPARAEGFFPRFPFGTDFTAEEQAALAALAFLHGCGASKKALARTLLAGLGASPDGRQLAAFERLSLGTGPRDRFYRRLLLGAWRRQGW